MRIGLTTSSLQGSALPLSYRGVADSGFEPLKHEAPDLQSGPFDRLGNPPSFSVEVSTGNLASMAHKPYISNPRRVAFTCSPQSGLRAPAPYPVRFRLRLFKALTPDIEAPNDADAGAPPVRYIAPRSYRARRHETASVRHPSLSTLRTVTRKGQQRRQTNEKPARNGPASKGRTSSN